jgi:hypothetical protein
MWDGIGGSSGREGVPGVQMKAKQKRKPGRPFGSNKCKPVAPEKIVAVMVNMGAKHSEIAKLFGVKGNAFRAWQRQMPELRAPFEKGKARQDERVIDALYSAALGGNVLACIFWLKNRQPDKWRDRREFVGTVKTEEGPDEFARASDAELDAIIGTKGRWLLAKQGRETAPKKNGQSE